VKSTDELFVIPMISEECVHLGSPDVGLFTGALEEGTWIRAGQALGHLTRLGRSIALTLPTGFAGPGHSRAQIVGAPSERVLTPVGFRTPLYELAIGQASAMDETTAPLATAHAAAPSNVVSAPQSGRFYHRPGPDSPPFLSPGAELKEGTALGLIEVMKTFAHVSYHPARGLPELARMTAWIAQDGSEVLEGDPLLEFEPI